MLNERLDHLEKDSHSLAQTVVSLENAINLVKVEQGHFKDLFNARMAVIEKAQELNLNTLKQISTDIQVMASDAHKTPMGRELHGYVRTLHAQVDEVSDKLQKIDAYHNTVEQWRNNVNGALYLLKWVGAAGLISFGVAILRLIKLLP